MESTHEVHEFEVDPTANVGFVVFAWEKVEYTIEAAILELAGCPDYRARAFTTYMSFPSMWNAVRILLKSTHEDYKSIKGDLAAFDIRIDKYRKMRNALVHADWTGFNVTSENPAISAEDYDARKTLTRQGLIFPHDQIREVGEEIWQLQEHLAQFFADSCGLESSPDKYQLPLRIE